MTKRNRPMATVNQGKQNNSRTSKVRLSVFVLTVALLGFGVTVRWGQISEWSLNVTEKFLSENKSKDTVQLPGQITGEDTQLANKQRDDGWRISLVKSAEFVTESKLEQFVKSKTNDSFFRLNVEQASKLLVEYPWVKTASARKVWPNVLMVELEEHQPWLNLNNKHLVSKEGVIFEVDNIEQFETLPLLEGSFGDVKSILEMYEFFSDQMPTNEFRIVHLKFSNESGWTMKLANDTQLILGFKELNERLERFLMLSKTFKKSQEKKIDYLDFRYPTGVAVGWALEKKDAIVAQK